MAESDPTLEEFYFECEEVCERVSAGLRKSETGHYAPEDLDSMYRDLHSLKGAAFLFEAHEIGKLAHVMEACLAHFRDRRKPVSARLIDLFYKGLDRILQLAKKRGAACAPAEQRMTDSSCADILDGGVQALNAALDMPAPKISFTRGDLSDGTKENQMDRKKVDNNAAQEPRASATVPEAPVAETEIADGANTIRVAVPLLDNLMGLMGEMVLVRNQVLQYANRSDDLQFLNLSQKLDVVTGEIQNELMKTRMQPIGNVLNKFQRLVRDLGKELGKRIELKLIGTETELDKTLLEAVKDPLTHLVRNACDHGLETPAQRTAAGKPETAHIIIKAYHEGGQVIIDIADDGRGLAREKIMARAVERGLVTTERAGQLSTREIQQYIFLPGFSTAQKVTNISGRGVGMDVVKSNIERINGTVELNSTEGQGTSVRLRIPLTLAVVPAMIVKSGGEKYAIPQIKLVELVRVDESTSTRIELLQGQPICRIRGNLLPLVDLSTQLRSRPSGAIAGFESANILILNADQKMFGLIVDEIEDSNDIVVKPLPSFLKGLSVYSGATVLGDGSVAIILDVAGLAENAKVCAEREESVTLEEKKTREDVVEYLMFRLGTADNYSVPLEFVHRLEEVDRSMIECSGGRRVLRYRGGLLPVLSLLETLGVEDSVKSAQKASLVVVRHGDRLFGVEVSEILDVLSTTATALDETLAHRTEILGHLSANDRVIVVVDIDRVIENFLAESKPAAGGPENDGKRPARAGRKILFVEDTAFFRGRVKRILEAAGYEVEIAVDGQDAWTKLRERSGGPVAAVLSDIEMPRMTGIQLARKIRGEDGFKSLPLLALSTRDSATDVEQCLQAGFNGHMSKRRFEEIVLRLDQCLLERIAQ